MLLPGRAVPLRLVHLWVRLTPRFLWRLFHLWVRLGPRCPLRLFHLWVRLALQTRPGPSARLAPQIPSRLSRQSRRQVRVVL